MTSYGPLSTAELDVLRDLARQHKDTSLHATAHYRLILMIDARDRIIRELTEQLDQLVKQLRAK